MKTYQDLLVAGAGDKERGDFVRAAIQAFQAEPAFRIARDAEAYYRHENPTIMRAQKMVFDLMGRAVPDVWRPNHKIPCRYYYYFITQQVQFLLGNGIIFSDMADKDAKLGKDFDSAVQLAATYALNGGVSFGFWDENHLEVFPICGIPYAPSFVPLWDENTGNLGAGIRWWRLEDGKPLKATLYEPEGITDFEEDPDDKSKGLKIVEERKVYRYRTESSAATGVTRTPIGNYDGRLPIVPLFNVNRQSELVGGRETLDAYDLMVSDLINNTDEGNLIYWVLKNANAMDEVDDAEFLRRLRTTRVAHADGDDGVGVEHHTVEVPVDASEAAIDRLRRQLYDDFMALDVTEISGGAATATQIRAAYEPLNQKTSRFEYCVTDFLRGILALAGVDADPTYRRDTIVNQSEELTNVLQAAEYLDPDTITRQICGILGLIDNADEIIAKRKENEIGRFSGADEPGTGENDTEDMNNE